MASLSMVSPARRSANSGSNGTTRKSGSSRKHVPIKEYYIPQSPSVQELKQASAAPSRYVNTPSPSSRTRRSEDSLPSAHQQNASTPSSVFRDTRASESTERPSGSRTTSVARRVLLRGPDTRPPRVTPPLQRQSESVQPELQQHYQSRDNRRDQQEYTPTQGLQRQRQASAFRYEQDKASKSSVNTRYETFVSRIGNSSSSSNKQVTRSTEASLPNSTSYSRDQGHLPTPSVVSQDDVDSDFMIQFARDHKLELGAEVAQTLVRGSSRKKSRNHSHSAQTRHDEVASDNHHRNAGGLSPASLSTQSPAISYATPATSPKPPRPPKSSRRLSASPSTFSPVPPTPPPKADISASVAPQSSTPSNTRQSNKDDDPYASIFDDAEEDEFVGPFRALVDAGSYSRRTSMSSTRPSRTKRDRTFSTSSRSQSINQQNHSTPKTPRTPATPVTPHLPAEHALTNSQHSHSQLPISDLQESPSEAKILINQFSDHTQEDYERNRRLSSLLKGLGIQTRSQSPEFKPEQSLPEEKEEEEQDQDENVQVWQPLGSDANLALIASLAADEEDESIMLTGDSFQTAPEEGSEVWGQHHVSDHGENTTESCSESEGSEVDYDDYNTHLDEEGSQGSEADEKEDHHSRASDEKSYCTDDAQTSHRLLRHSYGRKPQPLPPEYTIDEVRKSLIEQRASLGITDSVLASILATESFCMPDGARLSMEQIAARLSMELKRASGGHKRSSGSIKRKKGSLNRGNGSFNRSNGENSNRGSNNFSRTRRTTSDHTLSSLPYAGRDRYISVTSDIDVPVSAVGQRRREQEREDFPSYLPENTIEIAEEPEDGYEEADLPPLPPSEPDPPSPLPPPKPAATVTSPEASWRQSSLSISEALALRPLPLELPDQDDRKPVENTLNRKRTRSVSAFQRLSSTFTGSTTGKSKTRKRLPSFFGGFGSSNNNKSQEVPPSNATIAASIAPTVSTTTAAALAVPQETDDPSSKNRKRASTGPPRLVDIAKEVTNTSDISNNIRPASPSGSTRSRTIGQLPGSTETWRSTLPEHLYASIARKHPKSELRRQEVIHELYRTEESFVNGLKGVVRVFSQPLRTPQGRWIAGVPTPISRLLDWLDDIVYLHSQVTAALLESTQSQGYMVSHIADTLLDFIPRLEVHQPYLIRFEAVTKAIDEMLLRPDSDFGEFVRMQQALPECGAMPLSSFLLKPVQRLMKYPLFFKQLGDLAPPHHPDHEATRELLEITDASIRAMEEVKVREEEYEHLKTLAGKIFGLPTGLLLAKRDRRLLAQGIMHRFDLSDSEKRALEDETAESAGLTSHAMSRQSKASPSVNLSLRKSGISDSAYGASPRPISTFFDTGSLAPSMSTGYSASSSSAAGWEGSTFSPPFASSSGMQSRATSPSTHGSSNFRSTSAASSSLRPDSTIHNRQKSTSPSPSPSATSHSHSLRGILKSSSSIAAMHRTKSQHRDHPLYAFIFSDIVLFTTSTGSATTSASTSTTTTSSTKSTGISLRPSKSSLKSPGSSSTLSAGKDDKTKYKVVDDWGVAKIIGIKDVSGLKSEHVGLLKLDLLPLWSEQEDKRPFSVRTAALSTTIYLSIPSLDVPSVPSEHASRLIEALARSYIHSLRNTIFAPTDETAKSRNQRHSTISPRFATQQQQHSSTAPFPRSPSQQRFNPLLTHEIASDVMPRPPADWETHQGGSLSSASPAQAHRPDDAAEREERLFWSHRFRYVRDELVPKEGIIDAILHSGLLHAPLVQIEAIVQNLSRHGDGAEETSIPDTLLEALRELKKNEEKLGRVVLEARKGVRMQVGGGNGSAGRGKISPVGLAISYVDDDDDDAAEDENDHHDLRDSQEILQSGTRQGPEEPVDENYDDDDGSQREDDDEDSDHSRDEHGHSEEEDAGIDCDHYGNDDETSETGEEDDENSGSEYDSEEQEEEESSVHYQQDLRLQGVSRDAYGTYARQDEQRPSPSSTAPHAQTRVSRHQQASHQHQNQQPSHHQPHHSTPQQRHRLQQQQQQHYPSPLLAQHSPQLQSQSSTQSQQQQQRYGAYYRPAFPPSSSSTTPLQSPAITSRSTFATPPALAARDAASSNPSSLRRERQASSSYSTRQLASSQQQQRERQPSHQQQQQRERQPSSHRYQQQSQQYHHQQASPNILSSSSMPMQREERTSNKRMVARDGNNAGVTTSTKQGIVESPSLEQVFTVQRAQRIPLFRRL